MKSPPLDNDYLALLPNDVEIRNSIVGHFSTRLIFDKKENKSGEISDPPGPM